MTETITLPVHRAGYPDADLDVIVHLADGGSAVGAWMGDRWVGTHGEPIEDVVVAWSPMPELEAA